MVLDLQKKAVWILDYGAGNLHSVANAISRIGYEPKITSSGKDLRNARAVILPGVGAAAAAMHNLNKLDLIGPIKEYVAENRPFFGVCMGMQLLLSISEEDGRCACLDIIPGTVKLLPPKLKTPHMGWNQVKQSMKHPVFDGIPDNTNFYFVHSYYPAPNDRSVILGETEYDITFCSAIARNNLVATQFHPEKSGEPGLRMYANFLKIAMQ
jgi:imidazole glycerol-phosphate synthase subunit HisH